MANSLELTGRAATHVSAVPALESTLHHKAVAAALALRDAARSEGIELAIVSSFRDFSRQVAIWNAKFSGERPLLDRDGRALDRSTLDERALVDAILRWSALPGASRHHWGTDIDVIDRAALPEGYRPQLIPAEYAPGGPFARLNRWLFDNAARFDFFRPYRTDRGGVSPEPWHLSYALVSVPALEALTVDVLLDAVAASSMYGREQILTRLPELHRRFVMNIDAPDSNTDE